MGMSADGILAYGYNLGGDNDGWAIEETDEYGGWEPEWSDGEEIAECMTARLLASVGFTETNWRAEGYYDRKREAEQKVPELVIYCSHDYPEFVLAAFSVRVYQGHTQAIDFAALEQRRIEEDWDGRLRQALEVLGVTPKQEQPQWLLASRWG